MPRLCSSGAGPTPESCRSCGELIEPPQTMTSRPARTVWVRPRCSYSTPTARLPSNRSFVASAFISTRTFFRFIAGRRKARAADMRRPPFELNLVNAGAFLALAVEVRVERQAGLLGGLQIALCQRVDGRAAVLDVDGTAAPRHSSAPVSLSSIALKAGSSSANDQPGLPAAAQAS